MLPTVPWVFFNHAHPMFPFFTKKLFHSITPIHSLQTVRHHSLPCSTGFLPMHLWRLRPFNMFPFSTQNLFFSKFSIQISNAAKTFPAIFDPNFSSESSASFRVLTLRVLTQLGYLPPSAPSKIPKRLHDIFLSSSPFCLKPPRRHLAPSCWVLTLNHVSVGSHPQTHPPQPRFCGSSPTNSPASRHPYLRDPVSPTRSPAPFSWALPRGRLGFRPQRNHQPFINPSARKIQRRPSPSPNVERHPRHPRSRPRRTC